MIKLFPSYKIACATMVYNEKYWLPLWLKYYRNTGDLFVLDNDSNDGSCDNLENVKVIPVNSDFAFDHGLLTTKRNEIIKWLLKYYHAVVFTEVDEFIIPLHSNLRHFVSKMIQRKNPSTYCSGYEVFQRPTDLPIDLDKPILSQRSLLTKHTVFTKPAILTKPLPWGNTHILRKHLEFSHDDVDKKFANKNVYLVHTHWCDRTIAINRHIERLKGKSFSPTDLDVKAGYHNYDISTLDVMFRNSYELLSDNTKTIPVPERWKERLPI